MLRGLLGELAYRGVKASYGALCVFKREGLSFKNSAVRQRAAPSADCPAAGSQAQVSGPAWCPKAGLYR